MEVNLKGEKEKASLLRFNEDLHTLYGPTPNRVQRERPNQHQKKKK